MPIVKSVGPNTDPWGTPLVTYVQGDCVPLIVTLCFLSVSQYSIHLDNSGPIPCALSLDISL